jgi:hypothetical protein
MSKTGEAHNQRDELFSQLTRYPVERINQWKTGK